MFGRKDKAKIATAGGYLSEVGQFLNQLHAQDPSLTDRQIEGRNLLWDKAPIDLDERAAQKTARVNQPNYVYYRDYGDLKAAKN